MYIDTSGSITVTAEPRHMRPTINVNDNIASLLDNNLNPVYICL